MTTYTMMMAGQITGLVRDGYRLLAYSMYCDLITWKTINKEVLDWCILNDT